MSSESYHEPIELLSEHSKNLHRAIVSLKEELDAVDWYQQRAEAASDPELSAVLIHNKNEEVEHAMMTLEWLRRNDPIFAANVGTYLNSSGPITQVEKNSQENGAPPLASHEKPEKVRATSSDSLGIGSLKGAP